MHKRSHFHNHCPYPQKQSLTPALLLVSCDLISIARCQTGAGIALSVGDKGVLLDWILGNNRLCRKTWKLHGHVLYPQYYLCYGIRGKRCPVVPQPPRCPECELNPATSRLFIWDVGLGNSSRHRSSCCDYDRAARPSSGYCL